MPDETTGATTTAPDETQTRSASASGEVSATDNVTRNGSLTTPFVAAAAPSDGSSSNGSGDGTLPSSPFAVAPADNATPDAAAPSVAFGENVSSPDAPMSGVDVRVPSETPAVAVSAMDAAPIAEAAPPVAREPVAPVVDPMEAAMEFMPPLDQIEVPGASDSKGRDRRGGGGRDRDRNDRGDRGDRGDRFSNSNMGDFKPNDVVTGTVVQIDSDGVLVDVGAKTEGLIRMSELSREPITNIDDIVKVGDKIDVLVMEPEGRDGHLLLSKKRADFEKSWDRVQEALGDGRTLQAMVSDRVRGGLVVDLGIRGFVPASHVGNGKLKNLEKFVGQSIPLKVLEVDREHRKVVLSHRLATEEEREQQKQTTIESLAEGQTRTGTVRRVTDYGAFVDLGGIDGLLHVSEMSWTRIKHPSDVVKVGDTIDVMILRLAVDQGRVSLGMRQILPDPWLEVAEKYHVNETVEGEVTRIVPFGVFVLLEGGIEGIIPNSELAHRRVAKPQDVVDQGQMVQVKVIDVRAEERRLTLSLRALQPREPAEEFRPREPRVPRPGGGPGEPGIAPPPAVEEGGGGRPRERRDRRRGRGEDEGMEGGGGGGTGGGGGGGDYRSYTSTTTSSEPRLTLGDMFGDVFKESGRGAGKAAGKTSGGGKRRRDETDEDEEFTDLDDAADVDAEADVTVDAEAETTDDEK